MKCPGPCFDPAQPLGHSTLWEDITSEDLPHVYCPHCKEWVRIPAGQQGEKVETLCAQCAKLIQSFVQILRVRVQV